MRSLYTKFIVITIGIMIFSSIIAFLISNSYYQHTLKPDNDEKNTKIALEIAAFAKEHPTVNLEKYVTNLSSIGYQFYLINEKGEGQFFGAPFRDKSLPTESVEQVLNEDIYHGMLHFPQETFVTGFFANELQNTIGVPLTHNGKKYALFLRPDIKLLFNEMHLLFGWLLAITIVLSIVMVLFSTKYLVRPISKLTTATKSLAQGNYQVELDSNRRDELGELSNSFLTMAQKIEQTDETRKEFISNISHDIQSPLANIKGYTNLLEKDTISADEKRQYTAIINNEITRMSTLTEQLLLLASLDRNEDLMKKQYFNVSQQMKDLIRNYQWQISEKDIMLSYSLPDIEVNGDPALLHTVWDNLLINAMKYNKPNGSIEISIEKSNDSVWITFADTGIGMKKNETKRIFDRFYRVDTARSKTIEGTGLGLSIVATIIHLHDGHIEVESKENEGTTFTVELPIH